MSKQNIQNKKKATCQIKFQRCGLEWDISIGNINNHLNLSVITVFVRCYHQSDILSADTFFFFYLIESLIV